MMKDLNPEMIRLARDVRGMTQEELADAADVRQGTISKLEIGLKDVSDDTAQSIATALQYPVSFFHLDESYTGLGISTIFYRKKASSLVKHTRRLQAEVNLCRIHSKLLTRDVKMRSPFDIEYIGLDEFPGKPSDIAKMLRASWKLPEGPVRNLVSCIENAGGFVFKFPFGTTDIDAISQWPSDGPPLFFINSQAPADRTRFSLAHELGHMVMHNSATASMEAEAHEFASEFLMPAASIREQLVAIDLKRAAMLKPHWRVSIGALIYRAHLLHCIPENKYRGMFMEYTRMGYKRQEPYPIAPEEPKLVRAIVNAHKSQSGLTDEEMAKLLHLMPDEYQNRYVGRTSNALRLAL